MNIYYVYRYNREDGSPYYIGMGHGTRIHDPHRGYVLPERDKRIFIAIELSEPEALLLEEKLTIEFGLIIDGTGILENKILGGKRSPRGMLGKSHTIETKNKISEGNIGKIRSLDQIERYKTPKSLETKEKIKLANIGRKDDGRYKKISETKKGKPWTDARRNAYNLSRGIT